MKRYHITVGAKTTADGTVITGYPHWTIDGQPIAREGDEVDCPACDSTGVIVCDGPHLVDLMQGRPSALEGDLCHCKCDPPPRLIANQTLQCQEFRNIAPDPRFTPPPTPFAAQPADGTHSSGFASVTSPPAPHGFNSTQGQEPGFYIVPKSTTRELLEANLFSLRDPAVMGKFQLLNPYRHDVKAGSMIVLSDPSNWQCSREEALLMEVAAGTNDLLETLSPEEADFMVHHRDEIQTFLARGSTAIGVGATIFSRNLEQVDKSLRDIEALHQRSFLNDGHLRSADFFAERQRLLAQLNTNLTTLTRKGIGFPDHPNLKRSLGISNRSLVHHWTQAGAPGQIPGYATHLDGVAKAAKYVERGGWIGTAIGVGASALKIQSVCTAGSTEACERVRLTEMGSLLGGGVGGWAAAGFLTAPAVTGLCVGLGVPTGGTSLLVCSVLAVGATSLAGGSIGAVGGEAIGEKIYEAME
ncbi:PAAR domain-containing protein [Pseudomonas kielensis]|uniref:PAAR domain-containing protein n=1 Tax=Pseudomonas kielensis TaxID=2762577 RepID=A0A7X1GH22_9PSED|nr:PAAR domain-containing protein [Pseudomonas kielensis]MBC2692341.1 PAAR domain-containing protein [Pseudomonas kielensis]